MTEVLKFAALPDRSVITLEGVDRIKFLQGLVTNDVRRLAPNTALYAGFLTGQGKLVCDLFLIADGERIFIDIATAHVPDFLKRLTAFKLRANVAFGESTPPFAVAAAWGPEAPSRFGLVPLQGSARKSALERIQCAFVDPRIAALGVRLIHSSDVSVDSTLSGLDFAGASEVAYSEHRLALGIADTSEIAGETCYPLEANFEPLHGVDFKKGCYVGQELTARMKLKGEVRKRILPVTGAAPLPEAGTPVMADGVALGPLVGVSGIRGLALVRLDRFADAHKAAVRAGDVPLSVHWPSWLPH